MMVKITTRDAQDLITNEQMVRHEDLPAATAHWLEIFDYITMGSAQGTVTYERYE